MAPSNTHQQPTASICATPRCGRPVLDAVICLTCHSQLRDDLNEIIGIDGRPGLVDELLVTMTLQSESGTARFTTGDVDLEPDRNDEPIATNPLPYDPAAGEALWSLHAALSTWCRHLVESRWSYPWPMHADGQYRHFTPHAEIGPIHGPWRPQPRYPRDEPKAMAGWLIEQLGAIRQDEGAGELVDEIGVRVVRARPALDPVAEREYLGPCVHCDCTTKRCKGGHLEPTDLYVPRGARQVRCPKCGASWSVEARRAWLLQQSRSVLLSAAEASRALPSLAQDVLSGRRLTASMIRNLGARGRLVQHRPHPNDWDVDEETGEPIEPPPRYQVGELLDLVIKLNQEEQDRLRRRQAC